ncbi:MAG: Fe-S cluster assembly protein SufD [Planctomycetaceae bacterium]|nr:Fe-S cluster assembly protein SufD [Planctomycetaceae bacterium]
MTDTMTTADFNQAGFEAFLASRREPEWMLAERRQAWSQFSDMQWPGRRDEEWMRTDIRLFKLRQYHLAFDPLDALPSEIIPLLDSHITLGGHVHTVDGNCVSSAIAEQWTQQGVVFGSLDDLTEEHADRFQTTLLKGSYDRQVDRFAALHSSFWSGGQFLYVPRGVHITEPLHVLSALTDGAADLGHTLVVLEDGASATLLAETASEQEDSGGLHCGAVELIVGDGASLRYVNLQNWGSNVWHFAQQNAVLGREANLQWTSAAIGSRLAKVNQHVTLAGEGANSQVNGVLFTQGRQHLSYHTLQHHQAAHCSSDFLYKSALQDKSQTVWRGMIRVDEGAQRTDGYQRNDNLLLSNEARADSIPGLESEADDVRCTHGSTSGMVDEELIYYAMCRGFTRKEATRLIVTGFFQQIFDRITIDSVRDALGLAIARRVRDYE